MRIILSGNIQPITAANAFIVHQKLIKKSLTWLLGGVSQAQWFGRRGCILFVRGSSAGLVIQQAWAPGPPGRLGPTMLAGKRNGIFFNVK